ncbi:hypothetical protein KEM52_006720 [Ascosphaera acerosa]|nr:hypothetical protein KEM52_006720 [Ascosphaera acerosa]
MALVDLSSTHHDDLFPSFDAGYSSQDGCSPAQPACSAGPLRQGQPHDAAETPKQLPSPESADHVLVSCDDTTIADEPTHHVDYLTHCWSEEDIWSTWRYVLSKRSTLPAVARLENASWRCWGKCRAGGLTVLAEKIDCFKSFVAVSQTAVIVPFSNSDSDSIVTVIDIVTAFNSICRLLANIRIRNRIVTAIADHGAAKVDSEETHRIADHSAALAPMSMASSASSTSSATTPTAPGKRHIKFNNEVVQCIAVDFDSLEQQQPAPTSPRFDRFFARGFDSCVLDCDDEDSPFGDPFVDDDDEDELSETGASTLFQRSVNSAAAAPGWSAGTNTTTPRSSFSSQQSNGTATTTSTNRTIAMLPSTTLKGPCDEAGEPQLQCRGPESYIAPFATASEVSKQPASGLLQSFYPSWLPRLPLPGLIRTDSSETIKPHTTTASSTDPTSPPGASPPLVSGSQPDGSPNGALTNGGGEGSRVNTTPSGSPTPSSHSSLSPPLLPSSASFSYAADDSHRLHKASSPISSDMFRPFGGYDEDDDDYIEGRFLGSGGGSMSAGYYYDHDQSQTDYGLVDKVLDTVNTAKDIAHVIWNVGWRT